MLLCFLSHWTFRHRNNLCSFHFYLFQMHVQRYVHSLSSHAHSCHSTCLKCVTINISVSKPISIHFELHHPRPHLWPSPHSWTPNNNHMWYRYVSFSSSRIVVGVASPITSSYHAHHVITQTIFLLTASTCFETHMYTVCLMNSVKCIMPSFSLFTSAFLSVHLSQIWHRQHFSLQRHMNRELYHPRLHLY